MSSISHPFAPSFLARVVANAHLTGRFCKSRFALSLVAASLLGVSSQVMAVPLLGADLATFTVLGASTVTNVPASTITGNIGVWSGGGANAITGFLSSPGVATSDPQVLGGNVHAGTTTGTPNAAQAQAELTEARNNLSSLGAGTLLAADLGGLTLLPGVYTVPAGTTNLSGMLTLNGGGNANAAWVFQMPATLITSPNSGISVLNTGAGSGVFWNVGSSATIDVNTAFLGNILALASITMNTGATNLCGRALADTGAVTLDQNKLSGMCSELFFSSNGFSGGVDVTGSVLGGADVVSVLPVEAIGTPNNVPEPGTLALLGLGMTILVFSRRKSAIPMTFYPQAAA